MALNIVDVQTSGGFFKPEDYKDAVAILVEVNRFEHQRPGKFGPKDTIHADVSVFNSAADVEAGKPVILKGTLIQTTILARDLTGLVGSATIVRLDKAKSTTAGRQDAWVWRPVDADVKAKVIEYAEKREAEIQAALAAVPSFD